MKTYTKWAEISLLFLLALFTAVNIAPKTLVMPSTIQMVILFSILIFLAVFLILFWQEKPLDEREFINQSFAGKTAYIVGCFVLLFGLLIQGIKHDIDPVIPITIFSMVSTKILVQRWKNNH